MEEVQKVLSKIHSLMVRIGFFKTKGGVLIPNQQLSETYAMPYYMKQSGHFSSTNQTTSISFHFYLQK